ncbi:MAG: hypothetical protein KDB11_33185 [Planctomycetales bacterium]|nr:hypothetical protein [Planctomycetales bacterium]
MLETGLESIVTVVFAAIGLFALYGFFWCIEWLKGVPPDQIGVEPLDTTPKQIKVKCPHCERNLYGANTDMIGDTAVCQNCLNEFTIEA